MSTSDRILDAVAPIFATLGYDGAGTRQLAAAAGVNVATLAYHFGGKEGLYAAVIDRVYERLLAVDLDLDRLPPAPADRVRTLVARLHSVARIHRAEIRILLRHVVDTTHLPGRVEERWLPRVLERVALAISAMDLPPGDHRLALLSVNHLLARYAVTEEADLARFGADDEVVARHIGEVAVSILGL